VLKRFDEVRRGSKRFEEVRGGSRGKRITVALDDRLYCLKAQVLKY
jgi:hypothetical protein